MSTITSALNGAQSYTYILQIIIQEEQIDKLYGVKLNFRDKKFPAKVRDIQLEIGKYSSALR